MNKTTRDVEIIKWFASGEWRPRMLPWPRSIWSYSRGESDSCIDWQMARAKLTVGRAFASSWERCLASCISQRTFRMWPISHMEKQFNAPLRDLEKCRRDILFMLWENSVNHHFDLKSSGLPLAQFDPSWPLPSVCMEAAVLFSCSANLCPVPSKAMKAS